MGDHKTIAAEESKGSPRCQKPASPIAEGPAKAIDPYTEVIHARVDNMLKELNKMAQAMEKGASVRAFGVRVESVFFEMEDILDDMAEAELLGAIRNMSGRIKVASDVYEKTGDSTELSSIITAATDSLLELRLNPTSQLREWLGPGRIPKKTSE